MMTFAGCAGFDKAGAPPLAVEIPADCEKILTTVPAPSIKPGDDARLALAKTRGALSTANTRIVKGRECFASVRTRFAVGS